MWVTEVYQRVGFEIVVRIHKDKNRPLSVCGTSDRLGTRLTVTTYECEGYQGND